MRRLDSISAEIATRFGLAISQIGEAGDAIRSSEPSRIVELEARSFVSCLDSTEPMFPGILENADVAVAATERCSRRVQLVTLRVRTLEVPRAGTLEAKDYRGITLDMTESEI